MTVKKCPGHQRITETGVTAAAHAQARAVAGVVDLAE